MSGRGRALLRTLALSAGLLLSGLVLWSLGPERVAGALRDAAPWMPLVVLLELGIIACDVLAARTLLAEHVDAVERATWIRSTVLAYAVGVVLPAGRAAGEAARAATLSTDVGVSTAAAAGARLQTAALFGTAIASLAGTAASYGKSSVLALALAGNAVLCGALGGTVLAIARWGWLQRWVARRWPSRLDAITSAGSAGRTGRLARASLLCVVGRSVQVLQYGVVLHAVGGVFTPRSALLAQGVHIVGATIGDAIPNQLGATDGAYRVFAEVVGLGTEPARAVSVALCVRAAQLSLAAIGWGIAMISRRER